jgi:RNA polymerase sigma-70 factor (ECF subfamily)
VAGLLALMLLAERDGPCAGMALVDGLDRYHVFHAVRADLLRRLGRGAEAGAAYGAAIACAGNERERDLLRRRRAEATGPG